MKERTYRVLKMTPELFLALEKAAMAAGMSPIDLAKFAVNSTLALFRKNGSKIFDSKSEEPENVSQNAFPVQVDLSKINQDTLNWLSAEATRRGCSLGEIAGQTLEAWFGYISADDAIVKNIKCPNCGRQFQVPSA